MRLVSGADAIEFARRRGERGADELALLISAVYGRKRRRFWRHKALLRPMNRPPTHFFIGAPAFRLHRPSAFSSFVEHHTRLFHVADRAAARCSARGFLAASAAAQIGAIFVTRRQ